MFRRHHSLVGTGCAEVFEAISMYREVAFYESYEFFAWGFIGGILGVLHKEKFMLSVQTAVLVQFFFCVSLRLTMKLNSKVKRFLRYSRTRHVNLAKYVIVHPLRRSGLVLPIGVLEGTDEIIGFKYKELNYAFNLNSGKFE